MSVGQLTDHGCVILDSDICYVQNRHTGYLVGTGPRRRDSQRLWELDWLRLPSAASVNTFLLLFVRSFLRKAEALSIATYLINIQPSFALRGGIPLEHLCGKTPDYSDL
ncbi:hypothetical protein U9M48_031920 [Paspalum notatum var. saurae]|uniref:Uncharacterized protein n=1 Tax=Paspalum notatum var. saurae TaxID=547442 RepID=A0AAQ3U683_PASNO